MSDLLRLCLDLNIWCAALLADRKGKQNTACQSLVKIVREGTCTLGSVQLIISWGMLNRLSSVLVEKLKIPDDIADLYIDTIKDYAEARIVGSPQLTLGGTGVIPLHDIEDRHVLETALAGQASILVTANIKDFLAKDTQIVTLNEHLIYSAYCPSLHIVKPSLMIIWMRNQDIPELF